ncbi:BPI fold-containing family B member 6-like [Bombina bombina]|uniref:BPI fold-containing family B member 6-like n=1 Tax=Bombina bombina TaxID=8345 RepID=UPI00235B2A05|nr:BPI fold-containing family B member 6-like [Bombina bombina]
MFLTLFSTSVGAFEVQDLEDFFTSVIEQVYTPTINDNLQTVFPLPNIIKMMKIDFSEGHIEAVKDLLLISVSVCKA